MNDRAALDAKLAEISELLGESVRSYRHSPGYYQIFIQRSGKLRDFITPMKSLDYLCDWADGTKWTLSHLKFERWLRRYEKAA